eukprot:m.239687 g.239687  ORF g.239687 m.239687 type:complete len:220 (-) comp16071_c1_seq2:589-1248(-)
MVFDFAGQSEFFVSHEVLMRWCTNAVFVVVCRLDYHDKAQERERVLYWLRFIQTASACRNNNVKPQVFIVGSFMDKVSEKRVNGVAEWFQDLLACSRAKFDGDLDGGLEFCQKQPYMLDCRKATSTGLGQLREELCGLCERIRLDESRMIPKVCEMARQALEERIGVYENSTDKPLISQRDTFVNKALGLKFSSELTMRIGELPDETQKELSVLGCLWL